MKRKFSRLFCTFLTAATLLSGCAENTDASKGAPDDTEAVTTTSEAETTTETVTSNDTAAKTTTTTGDTTTPAETTAPETTTTTTTAVTETLSPDGGFKNFGEYKDENGEVLLEVTDGMEYVDYIAYYHGYFKVTNVSDETVTELREKIAAIDMFSNTVEMMIEYPYGDNCVDIIKWENGKPDFENMKQYFDAMAEREYTFDNTLAPDEYCIISVTFTNGAEITTAATGTTTETEVPIHKSFWYTGKWESTYVDDDGNTLLSLTDGIDYVDTIGFYHGYYKLTNVYGKPVTDIREKLESFYVFTETDWMYVEYPFNDNCIDFIDWTDGKPDLDNINQSPKNKEEGEYTFDNTLDPEEYCIIYVVFTNGEEITTAAEDIPDQTSAYTETTTKAPETTTEKKTVTTTSPIEDEIPENTTERPLDDPIYSKYMPSDKIIKEAAQIAARDKNVIVAIYENDKYEVMTPEEMEIIEDVLVVESIISEESYNDMVEMYEKYPELMEDGSTAFLADYQSFVQFWLESFPDCKDYFDENGKAMVNTAPCFVVSFSFDGDDGNIKLEEVAETTIRWAFAQRTDDKNFNFLVDEAHKSPLGDSVVVRCTYNGGKTAHAEFIYYSHSIVFDPEVTLTF